MVDDCCEYAASCIVHERLSQCRAVFGVEEARVNSGIEDCVTAHQGNTGRFVNERNLDLVRADCACVKVGVCACAHSCIEPVHQVYNGIRVVLDLDQADHVCIDL